MKLFLTLLAAGLLFVRLPTASGRDDDSENGFRNLTLGQRECIFKDRLLFEDTQKQSASFLRTKSKDVCYPKDGLVMSNINITAIKVTDLMPKDEGGYAFVTEGGVSQKKACFHLKTQRGNGYHFGIEIWGHNNSMH